MYQIQEYTWVHIAQQQLRDEAAQWWKYYGEFTNRIQSKFASQARISQPHKELYIDKKPEQSVEQFIRRKIQLHRRLRPDISETDLVSILAEQLLPSLRPLIKAARTKDVEELIGFANEFEIDIVPRQPSRKSPKCHYCSGWHLHKDCPEIPRNQGNYSTTEG